MSIECIPEGNGTDLIRCQKCGTSRHFNDRTEGVIWGFTQHECGNEEDA